MPADSLGAPATAGCQEKFLTARLKPQPNVAPVCDRRLRQPKTGVTRMSDSADENAKSSRAGLALRNIGSKINS
jgi:hypothetical protein